MGIGFVIGGRGLREVLLGHFLCHGRIAGSGTDFSVIAQSFRTFGTCVLLRTAVRFNFQKVIQVICLQSFSFSSVLDQRHLDLSGFILGSTLGVDMIAAVFVVSRVTMFFNSAAPGFLAEKLVVK